jgi:hypothetical protein
MRYRSSMRHSCLCGTGSRAHQVDRGRVSRAESFVCSNAVVGKSGALCARTARHDGCGRRVERSRQVVPLEHVRRTSARSSPGHHPARPQGTRRLTVDRRSHTIAKGPRAHVEEELQRCSRALMCIGCAPRTRSSPGGSGKNGWRSSPAFRLRHQIHCTERTRWISSFVLDPRPVLRAIPSSCIMRRSEVPLPTGAIVALTRSAGASRHLARRECEACGWKGEISERKNTTLSCPHCYGATHAGIAHDEPLHPADPRPPEKNPHAAALGRLGGLKGGRARAVSLSPAKRREIARKAARARWRKQKS